MSDTFYEHYASECAKKKNGGEEEKQAELDGEEEQELKVFEVYGPLLQKMICETNLIA